MRTSVAWEDAGDTPQTSLWTTAGDDASRQLHRQSDPGGNEAGNEQRIAARACQKDMVTRGKLSQDVVAPPQSSCARGTRSEPSN